MTGDRGKIFVLTGAGISAESGLPTFRAADGLWEDHRVEDVASPEGFDRDPDLVHRFYNERRRKLLSGTVAPNAAHRALADLETSWPGEFLLVTQNIDNLHERAGSRSLVHMHGEILKSRCLRSGRVHPAEGDLRTADPCPCCRPPARLRPHVVWFGEEPLEMERTFRFLAQCRLFVSIGTSGNVYPAAGFVQVAKRAGARAVELNLEPSLASPHFDEHRHGPATAVVPAFVAALLKTR